MRVAIYTRARRKKIWSGAVLILPRVGESVIIREGWCSEEVYAVDHDLTAKEVDIILKTGDALDEYPELV